VGSELRLARVRFRGRSDVMVRVQFCRVKVRVEMRKDSGKGKG
jgi:hypothetical protein